MQHKHACVIVALSLVASPWVEARAQSNSTSSANSHSLTPIWRPLASLTDAGPAVWQLVDTPADSERVFAATSAGIAVSLDRGATWELRPIHGAAYSPYPSLAVSPLDPDLFVICGFGNGTFRSTDGGLTWSGSPVPGISPYAFGPVFAPSSASVLYVPDGDTVWRSIDAGASFSPVMDGIFALGGYAAEAVVDAQDELHAYVLTYGLGVHETSDGGVSWTLHSYPPALSSAGAIALDPNDGNRIMLGDRRGMFVSTDGGATWSASGTGIGPYEVDFVAFDRFDSARMYACTRMNGLSVSTDGGATWTYPVIDGLEPAGGGPQAILTHGSDPSSLVLGDWGGVFRSTDGGSSFERANRGLSEHALVMDVEADPFDPAHLVAKTGGSAYSSSDAGLTWAEAKGFSRFFGYGLSADPTTPGRFYAGGFGGSFWRSEDAGATFQATYSDPAHWFVKAVADPLVPGRIYATGDTFWRSDDAGATFVSAGAPIGWCWGCAVSPLDPDIQYVGGSGPLFRTEDGGATWIASELPPPDIVREIVADPSNVDRAYAAVAQVGMFRTDDRGRTWTPLAGELLNSDTLLVLQDSTAPFPMRAGILDDGFLFGNDVLFPEVYVSLDAGVSAVRLSPGIASALTSFTTAPTRLYAGTWGAGVLELH